MKLKKIEQGFYLTLNELFDLMDDCDKIRTLIL